MNETNKAEVQARRYRATVVVIDDEENMCKILSKILASENYHVTIFTEPGSALEHIRKSPPDVVLTDVRMPEISGMDVLRETKQANPSTNVVVMTAYGTIEGAIEAMKCGAFDYVTKPFKTDELLLTLGKALENTRLVEANEALSDTLQKQTGDFDIIGQSSVIRDVLNMIIKVAPTSSAVLIRGESGTGKELVAKAIHRNSPRSSKRFVAINCASIPEPLLESELFGHEKGSFTGADRTKMGLIELASQGTLFLDEIGDLPLTLQAKILRVLQEQEIQRVGGLQTIPVDVRLVAATNRDLKTAIDKKEFRADLFFRLNVITIQIPPLRERRTDVSLLVEHFLQKAARKCGKPGVTITPETVMALNEYSYPGNVRELENIVERMAVLCDGNRIELRDLPLDVMLAAAESASGDEDGTTLEYKDAKDKFEREYLARVIDAARGNISEAARISGISRRHFYEKLEKLNIKADRRDKPED